jgi:hypothetical protein
MGCIRGAYPMIAASGWGSSPVPEPAGDIEAQIMAALDPDHPKRACFCVPQDAHIVPRTLDAYIIDRPEGTLVTLHKQLADAFQRSADDVTMAWLLGYPEDRITALKRCCNQPAIAPRVVQARDADDHVVSEALTSPLGFLKTCSAIQKHVPEDGKLVILKPVAAITRRVAMRWIER